MEEKDYCRTWNQQPGIKGARKEGREGRRNEPRELAHAVGELYERYKCNGA